MKKSVAARKSGTTRPASSQPEKEARRFFGMRALGALIDPVARPALKRRPSLAVQIILDWPHIVGPALARMSTPRKLSGGTLTIACAGPAAVEMQYLIPQLLERINSMAGGAPAGEGRQSPLLFRDQSAIVTRVRIIHDAVLEDVSDRPARKPAEPITIEEGHRQPIHDVLQRLGGHISARERDKPNS
ncbi:DUF721 domain-containing protein [Candidatus Kirkpatrickella diaphorinae]|uniref:DUF721 domain-containing protein n=1 Tax=Candidatus Kirkpatrickella diaphorinae TaxID=2984322 RepID=A0ABY6GI51_9PROT|nr:DUF721 domain-containing protein [Candidatus Kirkpatrickella diaphorinae]UYH50939.1 DUF721 domain-containing protein [Candidatus Kirkpatrickella diaphorinae]